MPPRWVIVLVVAWLVLGVGVTLLLHVFHHQSFSP
jgi:hypothetical protein